MITKIKPLFFFFLIGTLFLTFFSSENLFAQWSTKSKKHKKQTPKSYLTIIALGPIPKRRFKMPNSKDLKNIQKNLKPQPQEKTNSSPNEKEKNKSNLTISDIRKIPIFLPPKAYSTPPNALFYKKKIGKKKKKWKSIRIGFNNASSISSITPEISYLLFLKKTKKNKKEKIYQKYFFLPPFPPATQLLIFLTPTGDKKTPWKTPPHISTINLSSKKYLQKNLIIKNFSNKKITFSLEQASQIILSPGKEKSFNIGSLPAYHSFVAIIKKNHKVLANSSFSAPPKGSVLFFAFYNANPATNSKKSVGVFQTSFKKIPKKELTPPQK